MAHSGSADALVPTLSLQRTGWRCVQEQSGEPLTLETREHGVKRRGGESWAGPWPSLPTRVGTLLPAAVHTGCPWLQGAGLLRLGLVANRCTQLQVGSSAPTPGPRWLPGGRGRRPADSTSSSAGFAEAPPRFSKPPDFAVPPICSARSQHPRPAVPVGSPPWGAVGRLLAPCGSGWQSRELVRPQGGSNPAEPRGAARGQWLESSPCAV